MVEKEQRIPLKLQRYLMTIARRDNVERISVAVALTHGGKLLVRDGKAFCRRNAGQGIDSALDALLDEIGAHEVDIRYIGYLDSPEGRSYNFEARAGRQYLKNAHRVDLADAASALSPMDAKALSALLKKKDRNDGSIGRGIGWVFPSLVFVLKNCFL